MTFQEIELVKNARKIELQVFKNLYDGEYLLIWNNGQICGKYKTFPEAETIVYGTLEEREIEY